MTRPGIFFDLVREDGFDLDGFMDMRADDAAGIVAEGRQQDFFGLFEIADRCADAPDAEGQLCPAVDVSTIVREVVIGVRGWCCSVCLAAVCG